MVPCKVLVYTQVFLTIFCVELIRSSTAQAGPNVFRISVPQNETEYEYAWFTTDDPSLVLRLKTCSEGYIALAREPRHYSQYMYFIAVTKETISITRREQRLPDVVIATGPTPDGFLGCNTWRYLWVGWEDYNITVGKGQTAGENLIVGADDSERGISVAAVSVSSSENSKGGAKWEIRRDYVRAVYVWTNRENEKRDIWITENERGYVVFGVRSCKQAKLFLNEGIGKLGNAYTLVLGANQNRISKIVKGEKTLVKVDTPGLVDCEETRYFWISWLSGVIEVGRGMRVRDRIFMSTPPGEETRNLTALSIISQYDDAHWQFRSIEENTFLLLSEAGASEKDEHIIDVSERKTFIFRVRACRNAILELKRTPQTGSENELSFVRITIGTQSNKVSLITYMNDYGSPIIEDTLKTPGILSCKFMRSLWFSWKDTEFRLGRGMVPFEDEIDSIRNRYAPLFAATLQLASKDKSSMVEWQVNQNQGRSIRIRTQPAFSHNQAWYTVADITSLVFKVRTERSARLLLATFLGNPIVDNYEILLQNEQGVSEIRKGHSVCDSKKTSDILSDSEGRFFWVNWHNGHIEVGLDKVAGQSVLLACDDKDYPYEVNAVSFAGDLKTEWAMSQKEGPSYIILTNSQDGEDMFDNFWLATHRQMFPFMVMSPDPVTIVLTRVPGQVQDGDIEVYIGIEDNTAIGMSIHGDPESFRSNKSFDVLSEHELREFCVMWYERTLLIGRGRVWYDNVVMLTVLDAPIKATGLVLSNGSPAMAEWQINPESATVLRKKTPATYWYNQLWKLFDEQTDVRFRVKTREAAHLLLTPGIGHSESIIDISIGDDQNRYTVIRNSTGDKDAILVSEKTPSPLSSQELRPFWASWDNGYIRVGKGYVVGVDGLAEAALVEDIDFHSFSISTETFEGEWEISNVESNIYHIKTPAINGSGKFDFLWMHTIRTDIQFKVLTCSTAHIALFASVGPEPAFKPGYLAYEVVINEETVILYQIISGDDFTEIERFTSKDTVIQCGRSQDFWMSWEGGLLRIGQGSWPNRILLEHPDPLGFGVNAFSFGGGLGEIPAATQWEIAPDTVDELAYQTLGKRDYDQAWMTTTGGRDFFTFEIQSCGNISIVLAEMPGVTEINTYEIDIGNGMQNSETIVIRKNGMHRMEERLMDILSCSERRGFWVSWRDNVVSLGQGSMFGPNGIIHWKDNSEDKLNIRSIAATSYGGTTALWSFFKLQENMFEVITEDAKDDLASYAPAWFPPLNLMNKLTFTVIACKNARLALRKDPMNDKSSTYEVILGAIDKDTGAEFCALRDAINGTNISIKRTTGIVTCNEPRDFWVTWDEDEIQVGAGQYPGQQFLHYNIPGLFGFTPNAISMATGPDSRGGRWAFPLNQVEGFHVKIKSDMNHYEQFWMSTRERNHIIFSIKSCGFAKLALSSIPFQTNKETYEIEIQNSNGNTLIRDGINGGYFNETGTPSILSCTDYNTFWLKFSNHSVTLGEGPNPNQKLIVQAYKPDGAFRVNSLGITMGGNDEGTWNFPRSRGNVFRALTHTDARYAHGFLFLSREHVTFQVRACADARIALLGNPGDWSKDSVEVILGSYANTMVEIKDLIGGKVMAQKTEPHIVDCDTLKPFWISWRDGLVSVGNGGSMGRPLITWAKKEPRSDVPFAFSVRALTFATGTGEGEWEFDQHYEECVDSFRQVYTLEDGMESTCQLLYLGPGSLDTCKQRTCDFKGNAINYKGKQCRVMKCERDDLKLKNTTRPADIYSMSTVAETYMAQTTEDYKYNQHWISVTWRKSVTFMVMACSNAHLALAAIPGNSNTMAYEVVIGGLGNRRSLIRKSPGWFENPEVIVDTPHILDCTSLRPFWISWQDNWIRVGTGLKVGLEPFLTWKPEGEMHIINSVGLTTADGVSGQWLFGSLDHGLPIEVEKEDKHVFKTTPDGTHLVSIAPAQNSFIFTVRACSDAVVSVMAAEGHAEVDSFEVTIGSEKNTQTSIKIAGSGTTPPIIEETPGILVCDLDVPFWLRWQDNTLSLGLGPKAGLQEVIRTNLAGEFPIIHAVSMATIGVDGYWTVSRSMGFYLDVVTPSDESSKDEPQFNHIWIVEEVENHLVFLVRSCSTAFILFSYNINETSNSYLVKLGDHDAYIRDGLSGDFLDKTTIQLDCAKMAWFWVRWYQGLEVGRERIVGQKTFLSTHDPVGKPIRVASFSSGNDGSDVTWRFPDIADDVFIVKTVPDETVFKDVWVYSTTRSVDVEVRACPTAMLYLGNQLPSSDWESSLSYTITLADGNSSISRYPIYPNSTLLTRSTPRLVQCDKFTKISIEWSEESIKVIKGSGNQRQAVMFIHDDSMININTVSLGTNVTASAPADWRFARHMGKGTLIATHKEDPNFTKWLSVGGGETGLVFKLQVSLDAHLILCQFVGVVGNDCYEIVLSDDTGTSSIKSYINGDEMDAVAGNFLDGDSAKYFWVSWDRNVIEFGQGTTVGYEVILTWDASKSPYVHPVHGISMMTYQAEGLWEFSRIEDLVFEVTTPMDATSFDSIWLRLRDEMLPFKVATCPSATILLTQKAGDIKSQRFEVLIEMRKVTISLIAASGEKRELGSKQMDYDLLRCDHYTSYIVAWRKSDEKISSVYLRDGNGRTLITVFEKTDMQVWAMTFATDRTSEGTWSFRDNVATVATFRTPEKLDESQLSYKIASRNHVFFTVRTKGPAHIILQEHFHSFSAYEFIIGLENNQKTCVKMRKNSDVCVAVAETPEILSENDFMPFWISWSKARVALGQGVILEEGVIMSYTDEDMAQIAVQYASFSTGWGSNGTWEFSKYKPDQVLLRLPGHFTGTTARFMLSSGQNEILFGGRYCDGGFYIMLESDQKSILYEVRYEMAYRTFVIYRLKEFVHIQAQHDLISCYEDQVLWVGWEDGLIMVSLGGPAGKRICEWQDPNPLDIHHVHFETASGVDLVLPRYMGSGMEFLIDEWSYSTPYTAFWYTLNGRTSIIFALTSSTDGKVMFSETPAYSVLDGYEVQFKKKKISLIEFKTGKLLDSSTGTGLFNNNYPSYFWATWDRGELKVGQGAIVGQKPRVHTFLPPGYDIIAAGFDATRAATWTFSQDTGNTYLVLTSEDDSFKQSWFMPKSRTFMFSVMALLEARVLMLQAPGDSDAKELELVLGAFDNTGSALFEGDTPVKSVEGRGQLNQDLYKRFWIQWFMTPTGDSRVNIGEGMPGENIFINYTMAKAQRIEFSTIGLGESSVSSANWKIPQDQEVMTRFVSPPTGDFNHWMTLVGRQNVVFRLNSCTSARILLVSELENRLLPSTEIVLDEDGVSYIHDSGDDSQNVTADTPDLLDCLDHRAFWVHWTRKAVLFGKGAIVKKGTLMRYTNPNLHQIVGMGLGSNANKEDKSSTWEFFRHTGNVVYEKTTTESLFSGVQIRPADQDNFIISATVRTCQEATIGMFPFAGIHQSDYAVVFGSFGNSMSEILRGNLREDSAPTPTLMRDNIDMPVWVSWEKGKNLTAGLGDYPGHPLLSFVDPEPMPLEGVGFRSGSTKCDGHWAIDMNIGDMIFMETPGGFSNAPTTVSVLDTHQLKFQLKARKAAHIALSVIPGHLNVYTYEIVLEEVITGNSYIKDGIGGKKVASAHTPGILSDEEFRSFWIKWRKKVLEFGKGTNPSISSRLLYFDKVDLPPFAMVTFASYTTSSASWEITVENNVLPDPATTSSSSSSPSFTTTSKAPTSGTTSTASTAKSSSTTRISSTTASGGSSPKSPTTSPTARISSTTASGGNSPQSSSPSSPPESTSPGIGKSTTPKEGSEDDSEGLSPGAIVGIVFGALLGAMLIIFTVTFIFMRIRGQPRGEGTPLNNAFQNPVYDNENIPLDDASTA